MDFGVVKAGSTVSRRIRICDSGGSALEITNSKPPFQQELRAEYPTSDLYDGQLIASNDCAYGPVDIAAQPQSVHSPDHSISDIWILNTDDVNFGVQDVEISATISTPQVGPSLSKWHCYRLVPWLLRGR